MPKTKNYRMVSWTNLVTEEYLFFREITPTRA